MRNIRQALTTFMGRTLIYLSIFIVGSALHETLLRLMHPIVASTGARMLALSTIAVFVAAGALFANERHSRSRVTSAATLLVLVCILFSVGHSYAIADPYLLVIALVVAVFGAQPALHHKLGDMKKTILYSIITILFAIVVSGGFVYETVKLDSAIIQRRYEIHN